MGRKPKLSVPGRHKLASVVVAAAGPILPTKKSPDEAMGEFFTDVQRQQVFDDGMTFVDLVPKARMQLISREYQEAKKDPDFDLKEFVQGKFYMYEPPTPEFHTDLSRTPREHIRTLWPVLTRRNRINRGSLLALPYPYIVPGGRFVAMMYWDSYFTMLGLAVDDRWDLIEGMVKNGAYMIRKFGFIPNASRTYYLSRSQPPFFSHMVRLLAGHKGRRTTLIEYLPYMVAEYGFWLRGRRQVSDHPDTRAYSRVVRMPSGVLLARYYDNKTTPRPESLREDIMTAEQAGLHDSEKLYLDLRAGAESGWDFSSRWFADSKEITSIHTTDIVPVDLNCLMYQMEMTIAETYQAMLQPLLARKFRRLAEKRATAISQYMWSDEEQFFMDYDFRAGRQTPRVTLAGVFPLYAKIATSKQAAAVAGRIERDFLKPGGLVTTLIDSGQQWDSPNGWAPLQWIAIQGLREYGYHDLAERIKRAWIDTCLKIYREEGKMVEKYDVVSPDNPAGGGEYPLQDGFGWTNAVLAALLAEDEKKAI